MDDACLVTLLERLSSTKSLENWSATDDDLIEVRAELGFCIYEDQNGLAWNVFGLPGQIERIQIDLKTTVHPCSSYENDQALDEWIDEFYRTHDRLSELLERPADYVGYFEDAGFPDERGALAYGPLSIERLRLYRTYLVFQDKLPESG